MTFALDKVVILINFMILYLKVSMTFITFSCELY
jgi:hypothetical protein